MWVFTGWGFVSIVANKNDPEELLVRARVPGHLETLFPEAKVIVYNDTDYRYRAFLPRKLVAERLADLVEEIDYTNLKDAIPNGPYSDTLSKIWELLVDLQSLVKKLQQKIPKARRERPSRQVESNE